MTTEITAPCKRCGLVLPARPLSVGAAYCAGCRAEEAEEVSRLAERIRKAEQDAKERRAAELAAQLLQRVKAHPAKCLWCGEVLEGQLGPAYCEGCRAKATEMVTREAKMSTLSEDVARWANLPNRPPKLFANFTMRPGVVGLAESLEAAMAWCKGEGKAWLVLCGATGLGKSHLAEAAVRDQVGRHERTRWENVPELLDRLRGRQDEEADRSLALIAATPWLVLDDLDKIRPTDWALERLYMLVNSRAWRERRTLFTTNESRRGLASRLGQVGDERAEAIADRVFDRTLAQVCVLEGPSYR